MTAFSQSCNFLKSAVNGKNTFSRHFNKIADTNYQSALDKTENWFTLNWFTSFFVELRKLEFSIIRNLLNFP